MRALMRVCDKVCTTQQQKTVFQKLGSMITKEHSEELVLLYFNVLSGDQQLEALPADVIVSLPFVSDI